MRETSLITVLKGSLRNGDTVWSELVLSNPSSTKQIWKGVLCGQVNYKSCPLSNSSGRQRPQDWPADGILLWIKKHPFPMWAQLPAGCKVQGRVPSVSNPIWPSSLCSTQIMPLYTDTLAPSSCLVHDKCLWMNKWMNEWMSGNIKLYQRISLPTGNYCCIYSLGKVASSISSVW